MANYVTYKGNCYKWLPEEVDGVLTGNWVQTACVDTGEVNYSVVNGGCVQWQPEEVDGILTGNWVSIPCPSPTSNPTSYSEIGGQCVQWIPSLVDNVLTGQFIFVDCPTTPATTTRTCKSTTCDCLNVFGYVSANATDAGGCEDDALASCGTANPRCPDGYLWGGLSCLRSGTTIQCSPGYRWDGTECVIDDDTFECANGYRNNGTTCVPCDILAAPILEVEIAPPAPTPRIFTTISNPYDEEVQIDVYYTMTGSIYVHDKRIISGPFTFTNNETRTLTISKPIPTLEEPWAFEWGSEICIYYIITRAGTTECAPLVSLSSCVICSAGTPLVTTVATPVITIDANDLATITCATPGAAIYYYLDNCDGTMGDPILYTVPFTMTVPIIFAKATKAGLADSTFTSGYSVKLAYWEDNDHNYVLDSNGNCILIQI